MGQSYEEFLTEVPEELTSEGIGKFRRRRPEVEPAASHIADFRLHFYPFNVTPPPTVSLILL